MDDNHMLDWMRHPDPEKAAAHDELFKASLVECCTAGLMLPISPRGQEIALWILGAASPKERAVGLNDVTGRNIVGFLDRCATSTARAQNDRWTASLQGG